MSDLSASFGRPFAEQVLALRLRLGQLRDTESWTDLWQAEHDRAFMVAGATKADVLADLALAVDKSIAEHRSLDEFRKDFRKIVETRGWKGWTGEGTPGGEAWRTKVIYRTNMATSYAAGRMAQLKAAGYKYWVYKHGHPLKPRLQHLAWDGIALPPDHPFWQTHAPPNGWGCTCRIRGADSERGIVRAGGDPSKTLPPDWDKVDPSTLAPPGIDKGWAYAPGASVAETVNIARQKIEVLPAQLGSDFGKSLEAVIDRAWPLWLTDTKSAGSHTPGLAGVLSKDLLTALEAKGIAPASAEITVNPGLLKGPKANRHAGSGDALTPEDWLALPASLRRPVAVLIDKKTGKLVYVLAGHDLAVPQIVVTLDYQTRIARKTVISNAIVSAYRPVLGDILGRMAGKLLELLVGKIG